MSDNLTPPLPPDPPADYELDYESFWKGNIEKDGAVDMDAIKRELFDYHCLMRNAAAVYCHVTGNQISKTNTNASAIISVADDIQERNVREAVEESHTTIDTDAVQHFLKLARKGRIGAASGGEKRAARVAAKLPKLIDDVPGLDDTAISGIVGLIRGASGAFETVINLLGDAGFKS